MLAKDPIRYSGLKFSGMINASISHEIRNVLAVINENAGLIKDLLNMADRGMPVDLQRIGALAEKFPEQVRRAERIVNNMNRFAHSVDKSSGRIDVADCLGFVADLSARFAAMRGVTLELDPALDHAEIYSYPFFLQNLLYLCIDYAIRASRKGKTVRMTVKEGSAGAEIRFQGLEALDELQGDSSEDTHKLLELLEAKIEKDISEGTILLILPGKIGT